MANEEPREALTRIDGAVILARGQGRRLGQPKGLVRMPGTTTTLVELVVALYREREWPLVLVTLPAQENAFARLLAAIPAVSTASASSGGETALTVLAGWRALRDRQAEVTHVWAHPVDLPFVQGATVSALERVSCDLPENVVRPVHRKVPGHPVVLPVAVLAHLEAAGTSPQQPLRELLVVAADAGAMVTPTLVPVPDHGVTQDIDTPRDLLEAAERWRALRKDANQ